VVSITCGGPGCLENVPVNFRERLFDPLVVLHENGRILREKLITGYRLHSMRLHGMRTKKTGWCGIRFHTLLTNVFGRATAGAALPTSRTTAAAPTSIFLHINIIVVINVRWGYRIERVVSYHVILYPYADNGWRVSGIEGAPVSVYQYVLVGEDSLVVKNV
jgi:hypothetical protein